VGWHVNGTTGRRSEIKLLRVVPISANRKAKWRVFMTDELLGLIMSQERILDMEEIILEAETRKMRTNLPSGEYF